MTYQYPLSVRYDEEGRPDGLKETLNVVVSSISATNWAGLPAVGGGIAVTSVSDRQIYFRNDTDVSGIPLPAISGYLFVSAEDGEFTYSWGNPPGTGGTPATTLNDLTDVNTTTASENSVLTYVDSIWVPLELSNNADLTTILNGYVTTASLANYATTASLANYVSIDAATEVKQIYYKSGDDTVAGIVAPTSQSYLYYNGANFAWDNPSVGTQYPTESPTAVSVWYLSGISSIALSAVSSTSATSAIIRQVFTGPRQVLYSIATNSPSTTNTGENGDILIVKDGDVLWDTLDALPTFTALELKVNNIESNYATDTELTNSINSLSTVIATTYASATQLNNYTTVTQFSNLSTTISDNFVSAAGDIMTGRLDLQKGLSAASTCYYDDVVVFRDETEGLSSRNFYFNVSGLYPTYASWLITADPDTANPIRNALYSNANYVVNLLDYWLYEHILGGNYTNPNSEVQPAHWSFQTLRNRTVNLLSATNASALKDVDYQGTNYQNRSGFVLKWASSVGDEGAWIPQRIYLNADANELLDLDESYYAGNIAYFSGTNLDLTIYDLKASSIDIHISSTNGIEGSSIHHTLQELDQRYVLVGGDTMSGVLNASALSGVNYIEFDLTPTVDREEGRLYWNDDYKTLELDSANQTSMYLGQEVSIRVINNTGTTLNKGQVVYVSGVNTNVAAVALASASSEATTHRGMGVLKQTLDTGDRGLMIMFGYLSGVDTSLYQSGEIVYLGTTPGSITNIYASAFSHPELIGSVVNVGTSSSGSLLIHVQHGYEITELHNVSRTHASATGQILVWNEPGNYYEPKFNYNTQAFVIENPSATEIPLFYAKHMNGIDEVHSYLVGSSSPSVSWTLYMASSVSNLTGATELVGDTTDDSSTGVTTTGTQIQNNGWLTLAIDGVVGSVSKLHLTIRTY